MQEGDRVMVFDSPGEPLDHYLYAHVLHAGEKGALVLVDHPGNLSHGTQKWVPIEKIRTANDAIALAMLMRDQAKTTRDANERAKLLRHAQHHDSTASQLS